MPKKFVTRDSIEIEKEEQPIEWKHVKITKETMTRLKLFQLQERNDKSLQEVAEELVNEALEDRHY